MDAGVAQLQLDLAAVLPVRPVLVLLLHQVVPADVLPNIEKLVNALRSNCVLNKGLKILEYVGP